MIKRILRKSLSINASTIPRNTRREYVSFRELIDDTHKKAALLDIDTNFPRSVKLDGKFISPWTKDTDRKGFDKILKFLITKKQNRVANYKVDDVIKPQRIDLEKISSTDEPHHTWIGHATSYCHMDGAFFLTDPIWSAVASPISFIGPKRYIEAPIAVEKLPLDFVLLSHTHYDHLDYATVQRIGNRAIW